jgi:hypothetical protein
MSFGTFKCPVCAGSIGDWVIRQEFTCHHCSWALSSNLTSVSRLGLLAAVAAECVLFAAIWALDGSLLSSIWTYLAFGSMAGALTWIGVINLRLRLSPLRPKPKGTSKA